MTSSLRATTALLASLATVSGHLPVAAIAQDFDASQCQEGEDEDACLARLLGESSSEEAGDGATDTLDQQDAGAEEATTEVEAPPEPDDVETSVEGEADPPEPEQIAEPDAPAEDPAGETETVEPPDGQANASEATQDEAANQETVADEDTGVQVTAQDPVSEESLQEETSADETVGDEVATEDAATDDAGSMEDVSEDIVPEAVETPADQAAPSEQQGPASVPGEDAIATDLTDATEEAEASAGSPAEANSNLLVEPEDITAEQTEALEAARAAADAAEETAPEAADAVAEAESEIAQAEAEASEAQQSLAVASDAAPISTATEETITEDTARRSDEDFGRLLTAASESEADSNDRDRFGLTGAQGLLLGGVAGLAIGSIIAGNRAVVNRADDRLVVLRPTGDYQVIRDDDTLLRRPGNTVFTDTFADGSSRNVVTQPDGTQIITVRDRDLRILRRTVVDPDGTRTVLIDDIAVQTPVVVSELPSIQDLAPSGNGIAGDADALARALAAEAAIDRGFSLAQIRSIRAVRDLAPAVNLQSVTFDTGSAAIAPEQARQLLALGRFMSDAIAVNPREVFLIEGHTDATGSASLNLGLSDRRAETVALALTEFFGVPPQNMVIQGYGEEFLLIPTLENERLNRRVAVRRITDLLRVAAAD